MGVGVLHGRVQHAGQRPPGRRCEKYRQGWPTDPQRGEASERHLLRDVESKRRASALTTRRTPHRLGLAAPGDGAGGPRPFRAGSQGSPGNSAVCRRATEVTIAMAPVTWSARAATRRGSSRAPSSSECTTSAAGVHRGQRSSEVSVASAAVPGRSADRSASGSPDRLH